MYKLDFRKAEEPEIKLPTYAGSLEKTREFQRNICFIDYAKAFVWITTNCEKFLKRWEYQTTWFGAHQKKDVPCLKTKNKPQ